MAAQETTASSQKLKLARGLHQSRLNLLASSVPVLGGEDLYTSCDELAAAGIPAEDQLKIQMMQIQRSFGLSSWVNSPLGKFTWKTLCLQLSQSEVVALYHHALDTQHLDLPFDFVPDPKVPQIGPNDLLWTINHLKSRVTSAIKSLDQKQCFLKLNTRSPKDSLFYDDNIPTVRNSLTQVFKTLGSFDQQAINIGFFRAMSMALACEDGEQAMDYICRSFRCLQDLEMSSMYPIEEGIYDYLIVREWSQELSSRPQFEFRMFISDGQLTAITQYFDWIYDPELAASKASIQNLLVEFFNDQVKPVIALKSYLMDIYLTKDHCIYIIEFNPFATGSTSGLFSWKNPRDVEVMHHGPLELRVVEAPPPKKLMHEVIPHTWQAYVASLITAVKNQKEKKESRLHILTPNPMQRADSGHGLDKPPQCNLQ